MSLTVKDVAAAWDVHPRTVYRWLKAGRLKEGRDYYVTPGSVGAQRYRLLPAALPPKARKTGGKVS